MGIRSSLDDIVLVMSHQALKQDYFAKNSYVGRVYFFQFDYHYMYKVHGHGYSKNRA